MMGVPANESRTAVSDSGEPPPRGSLSLTDVGQVYGDVVALSKVSLEIPPGEFLTLLGPSGCGKTTLLRIIAGFLEPSFGRICLDERDITRLAPHRRPINMVFQRPALFPHLDVSGNIGFGLKLDKLRRAEIEARVAEVLRLVHLEGFGRRRGFELSGGQMQRVALARALVKRPRVLLLDEPLSALDLKIRLELETELRRLHRETQATFVFVTHDQREALSLSSRIAVFDHGQIEQVGTPREVYRDPRSPFAARFVGDANVLPIEVFLEHGRTVASLGGVQVKLGGSSTARVGPGWLIVRPESIRVEARSAGGNLSGTVEDVAFRGTGVEYRIRLDGITEPVKAETPASASWEAAIGDPVVVGWAEESVRILPRESQ